VRLVIPSAYFVIESRSLPVSRVATDDTLMMDLRLEAAFRASAARWRLIKLSYEAPGNRGMTKHKAPNEIRTSKLHTVHPHMHYVPPICCQYRSVSLRLFLLFPSASIGRTVTIEIRIERRRYIGGFSKPERTGVRFVSESFILFSPILPPFLVQCASYTAWV